ncbi:MAG: hypothetical protein LBD02_08960 [Christensenellaceae bacterium]|jgi:hypothetical protein|nr:hypothetical protein [Christensenellaceae bacterium]
MRQLRLDFALDLALALLVLSLLALLCGFGGRLFGRSKPGPQTKAVYVCAARPLGGEGLK